MKVKVGKLFRKAGNTIKRRSPEILITIGVGGVVASAVGACKATLKLGDTLDEIKEEIDDIHEHAAIDIEYEDRQIRKDLTRAYIKGGWNIVKLYGPSVAGGAASIGCIVGSHVILKNRFNGVVAAYNILDASYKGYRGKVKERLGEDEEKKLRYGIETGEYTEITTDKKGNEKTKKHKLEVKTDPLEMYSPYARIFDSSSRSWEKDPEYNLMFLRQTESMATDKLRASREGKLFLNEVYDMLDIPRTKAGQVVGWSLDKGDDFVDFGIYNTCIAKNNDFVNGIEDVIILDFNVAGIIVDGLAD